VTAEEREGLRRSIDRAKRERMATPPHAWWQDLKRRERELRTEEQRTRALLEAVAEAPAVSEPREPVPRA
jgi:hypothetical protein